MNKNFYCCVLLLNLVACSSQYAPLVEPSKNKGGYKEVLLANEEANVINASGIRYFLTYQGTTSDSKERITGFWHQRANELCANHYEVISHTQKIIHGSIRSPINGVMTTLGTQKPVDTGVIQCLLPVEAPQPKE